MFKPLTIPALAAILLLGLAAAADAGERTTTVTTPRGTYSGSAAHQCSGGTCTASHSVTGPDGKTASSQHSATCANGTCSSAGSATGPNGKTASRQGSTTCANGTCSSSATITAPNGQTYSRSSTASSSTPQ